MDDLLQWSAVGLALVALLAIARGSRSVQRERVWSAAGDRPAQPDSVAAEPSRNPANSPALQPAQQPVTPKSAIALTYRGVSYLRWR